MARGIAAGVGGMRERVPEAGEGSSEVPLVVAATIALIFFVSVFSGGLLRLWAPLIGVLGGSLAAAAFGMVNLDAFAAAAWIGLPGGSWPGFDVEFGAAFWGLLPAFAMLSLVGCIETYADSISVQRNTSRTAQPIDFRRVQGAINADGAGSAIAGALGTVPNTVYSSSVAVVELTGIAGRRVGWWGGFFLILVAFCPKLSALIAAIPGPVAGAFVLMILVMLFGNGMRLVNEGGLGFEVGIAVCLGFWVGFGFQSGMLFNEMLPDWAKVFLANGTTSGGLAAILMMALVSIRERSRDKLVAPLGLAVLPKLQALVKRFADRLGWDAKAEARLMLAAEEALLFLLQGREEGGKTVQLHARLRRVGDAAELEYVSAPAGSNVEAALTALKDAPEPADPADLLSLRLLRGMASEVRHMQYHGTDCLILRVDSRA